MQVVTKLVRKYKVKARERVRLGGTAVAPSRLGLIDTFNQKYNFNIGSQTIGRVWTIHEN